jgi:hypothetical protein
MLLLILAFGIATKSIVPRVSCFEDFLTKMDEENSSPELLFGF